MRNQFGRRLLFPTSFSDACFRTTPVLSEWMDDPEARLTLLHVYDTKKSSRREIERQLHSFFAEADQYGRCERILLAGDPKTQILEHCRRHRYDLLFLPASEPTGFPRIGHRSLRASLLREGHVPVWTNSDFSRSGAKRQSPKNVAYVMTNEPNWKEHCVEAAAAAARWNAVFHVIYVFPVPDVDDGTLAGDLFTGRDAGPLEALRAIVSQLSVTFKVHTSTGHERFEVRRLLKEAQADLAFMSSSKAMTRGLFGLRMSPVLNSVQCQFVCFPDNPRPEVLEQPRLVDQLALPDAG
ncbi:universal stress protein [Paludibaculum fermentans]|uniref:Universal stress protein n=1 Tax=Paludibaculum fermentans TaxID=1473598 RepID=A0A7S7SJK8_PALFE|nr:universal stress protein [Paludibaculum fermentans]QOY86813.1 universal stress protein [Paludibaculum fermentans]